MKTLHGSGISTNIIDNNEGSTNATVQTKCMHKTNDNQNNNSRTMCSKISCPARMTASYHSYLPSPRKTILILKTTDMELNNKKKNKKKIGKTQVSHHVKVNIRHINGAIQVENAKIIISMLLIFSCSIIMTLLLSTTPNLLCSARLHHGHRDHKTF